MFFMCLKKGAIGSAAEKVTLYNPSLNWGTPLNCFRYLNLLWVFLCKELILASFSRQLVFLEYSCPQDQAWYWHFLLDLLFSYFLNFFFDARILSRRVFSCSFCSSSSDCDSWFFNISFITNRTSIASSCYFSHLFLIQCYSNLCLITLICWWRFISLNLDLWLILRYCKRYPPHLTSDKIEALKEAGVVISNSPAGLGKTLLSVLGK